MEAANAAQSVRGIQTFAKNQRNGKYHKSHYRM